VGVEKPGICIGGGMKRSAKGAQRGIERGISLPSRLGSLGIVVSSPSGVQGRAPAENNFGTYYVSQNACS